MKKAINVVAMRCLALVLSFLLVFSTSGCLSFSLMKALDEDSSDGSGGAVSNAQEYTREADGDYNDLNYDELCDLLFEHEVTFDSLSYNQLVSNSDTTRVEAPRPATLGDYSYESTHEDNRFYKEVLEALTGGHTINISELDESQQLEAKYIEEVLRNELFFEKYFYYLEPLSPSTGAQAMLPLNLMDYSFRTVEDIDIYLEILKDIPRYFDQLILFEHEKRDLNLLMAQESIEDCIDEASAYTGRIESHILVETFNEMLDGVVTDAAQSSGVDGSLASLTSEQLEEYKQQNMEILKSAVIPAYETLITEMELLVPSAVSGRGIYSYPEGAEYYELTMKMMGFSESPSSAANTLDTALEEYWEIIATNAPMADMYSIIPESVVEGIGDSPQDYITYIQQHSAGEFASATELVYEIRVAAEASPNDFAMAYFMIPPVDNPQKNTIVYFPRNISGEVELFSTMAHEGYPGHMYQIYAYSLENPSNISKILGAIAYTEGWAMYAQAQAMNYLDTDSGSISAYVAYEKFLYGLQARIDIGVNFEGWTVRDVERFADEWGFGSAAQGLYMDSVQQPLAYLPYGLGVIEFDNLRGRAMTHQGAEFSAVAFHQKITSLGSIPFDMLEYELEIWLRTTETRAA